MYGIYIFYILFILGCIYLFDLLFRRDFFNAFIFVFIGVYIPFILYLSNWSLLIDNNISENIFFLFSEIIALFLFFGLLMRKKLIFPHSLTITSSHVIFIDAISVTFILLHLIQNYLLSGYFLPSINYIDIHTDNLPILRTLTTILYPVLFANLLCFIIHHSKRNMFYILVILFILLLGKNSRIDSFIAICQLTAFFLFIKRVNVIKFTKTIKYFVISFAFFLLLVNLGIYIVTNRMTNYGKYSNLYYDEAVKYTGPNFMKDVLANYYGYFPLSINNLNLSVKYGIHDINYMGPYSFPCLYFGLLKINKLLDVDINKPVTNRVYLVPFATVTTAFWDFYYDYGNLWFIPIVIWMVIYYMLYKLIIKSNYNLFLVSVYFYLVPMWLFACFQNYLFTTPLFINILALYIICKYSFRYSSMQIH